MFYPLAAMAISDWPRRPTVSRIPWLLAAVFVTGQCTSHEGPPPIEPKLVHSPTVVPDRVVLTFHGNPATSRAVTWRTSNEVVNALAEITLAIPGADLKAEVVHVAKTEEFVSEWGLVHYHSIVFNDLQPTTKYAYRVGDGNNWSEWFQFTTANDEPEPFSFIYFGDAQKDLKSRWSRVAREAISDLPRAAFMLHAGDLIDSADRDAQWGEWFNAAGWVNGMIPNVPVPGNHEYYFDPAVRQKRLARHWQPQFTLPENGPAELRESCYWFDYQGARIIALNSNEQLKLQAEWLEGVLRTEPTPRWKIVTFHHPVFSPARNRDNALLRETWKPLFDRYRVDLVLTGHDHTYARTSLVSATDANLDHPHPHPHPHADTIESNVPTGASLRSMEFGTVYVVSVSGPKMYTLTPGDANRFARTGENKQLYQLIHVSNDEIRYEARTADSVLYDAFTLKKREGQANEIIEQIPDAPSEPPKSEPAQ